MFMRVANAPYWLDDNKNVTSANIAHVVRANFDSVVEEVDVLFDMKFFPTFEELQSLEKKNLHVHIVAVCENFAVDPESETYNMIRDYILDNFNDELAKILVGNPRKFNVTLESIDVIQERELDLFSMDAVTKLRKDGSQVNYYGGNFPVFSTIWTPLRSGLIK